MLEAILRVNEDQIGYVYAHRLSPEHLKPGSGNVVCEYEWRLNINGTTVHGDEPLEHRYGDGAWALIYKIIEAAGRQGGSPPTFVRGNDIIDRLAADPLITDDLGVGQGHTE